MLWLILSIFKKKCHYKLIGKNSIDFCLVLLCDQNSFGRSKMVLVWPNWFGLDHNDLVTTKMKWSRPKWNGHDQNELVISKLWFSTKMNHIWTWPFHFGHDQTIMVKSKSILTDQNCFCHIKGQGITILLIVQVLFTAQYESNIGRKNVTHNNLLKKTLFTVQSVLA